MIKNYGFPPSSCRTGNTELNRYKLEPANELANTFSTISCAIANILLSRRNYFVLEIR